jgi:hypothetical protein
MLPAYIIGIYLYIKLLSWSRVFVTKTVFLQKVSTMVSTGVLTGLLFAVRRAGEKGRTGKK